MPSDWQKAEQLIPQIVDFNAKLIVCAKACEMFNMAQKYMMNSQSWWLSKGEVIKIIPEDICKKYDDVFKGLGWMSGEHIWS